MGDFYQCLLKTRSTLNLLNVQALAARFFRAVVLDLILMLLNSLLSLGRSQVALQAEIIALRHQLIVLQRTQKPTQLKLTRRDRFLWVWLSRLWSNWRTALIIVKPETVVAWHRQGFRWYWTWKIRHG